MLPDGFGVFILTHGRPDRQHTLATLRAGGYSGRVWLVIDDEDSTVDEYRRLHGDAILTFSKADVAAEFDEGDQGRDRRSIFYARNASWRLARDLGLRYLLQLDDDYIGLYVRFDRAWRYRSHNARDAQQLDDVFAAGVEALVATGATAFALSQGGDHIGGFPPGKHLRVALRKAMNTFFLDVDFPFEFVGRVNEDVSTYTEGGRRGLLFLTTMLAQVNQTATQSGAGGMTGLYLASGTYLKSFFSVMYCPSAVRIGTLGDHRSPHFRLHHTIDWERCAAKIVSERFRKAGG